MHCSVIRQTHTDQFANAKIDLREFIQNRYGAWWGERCRTERLTYLRIGICQHSLNIHTHAAKYRMPNVELCFFCTSCSFKKINCKWIILSLGSLSAFFCVYILLYRLRSNQLYFRCIEHAAENRHVIGN